MKLNSLSIFARISLLFSLLALLGGCITAQPTPAESIIGQWQTKIGGFPVTLVFNDSTVTIGDLSAVAYQLIDSSLTYADGGDQVRIISFPSKLQMIQLDPLTGTRHLYTRLAP